MGCYLSYPAIYFSREVHPTRPCFAMRLSPSKRRVEEELDKVYANELAPRPSRRLLRRLLRMRGLFDRAHCQRLATSCGAPRSPHPEEPLKAASEGRGLRSVDRRRRRCAALAALAQCPGVDGRDKPGHDAEHSRAELPSRRRNFSLKMRSCGTPAARPASSAAAMSAGGPQT